MAKVQVRIRLNAGRSDLSRVTITPVDRAKPVRESRWRNRVYLWPNRGDYDVIVKSGEHVVVCDAGTLIAVYGYAADSRKRGEVFAALLRAVEGAKAAGKRVEAENAELLAEVVGSDAIAEVTAQMAAAGYSASRDPEKAAANVAAWLIKHYMAATYTPEEKEEEQQREEKERKEAKVEASVVARIERLLSELAEGQERRPAGEQPKPEEREEKPVEQQATATAAVDMRRGVIVLPDGTVLVRFWLLKFQKTSEYAVQDVKRKLNGSKEVEEVRKIPADVARRLSSLRREVNAMLADVAEVITLESVFGKSSGMWLVLYESGLEKVKRIYDYAVAEVKRIAQLLKLPKEQAKKLVDGYKMHVSQWWLPVDEAIALLEQLRTAVSSAAQAKQEKLRELKGYRARQELARYQQLLQKLQKLEQKLKELQHLAARA